MSFSWYIYSPPYTYKAKESYLKYPTVSLSLSFYDDDDSQPPLFHRPSLFFSAYRYKRNEKVCIYVSVGFQDDENESNACFMYEKYLIISEREEEKKKRRAM